MSIGLLGMASWMLCGLVVWAVLPSAAVRFSRVLL
jgi:hypothetical protein